MNSWTLVKAGLSQYRRTGLGVLLGSAVATATLVGALAVGDSVRHTLARQAEARVGQVDLALATGDRFVRDALALELEGGTLRSAAAVVLLPGVAATPDGSRRVREVAVHGVDARFFALSPSGVARAEPGEGEALLAEALAQRLGVAQGDSFVLRLERPSAVPRDMVLAPSDRSTALRLRVAGVLTAADFGHFSLTGGPGLPANLFLSRAWLQTELELEARVNLLVFGADGDPAAARSALAERLRERWTLADAELRIVDLGGGRRALETERLFLDAPVVEVLESSEALRALELQALFTYFVNALVVGERSTPYSMVTAVGALGAPATGAPWQVLVPDTPDGVLINDWLAQDLAAAAGDTLTLRYWAVDPSDLLVERARDFRVEGVLPLAGLADDPGLMPAFPGLADADSCREWEPGTPVDLASIRDQDEAYWEAHRGTPKAFLALAAGRAMWSSRFGALSAVRFPARSEDAVRSALRSELDPARLGLVARDVRSGARFASDSPTDFGGLFLGLSFFLIVAALLLTTQLFQFGVEERVSEIGLLAALGFPRQRIRALLAGEALVIAVLGGLLGVPLGLVYTRGVLHGLSTIWQGAVAGAALTFHAQPTTVALGAGGALIATLGAVLLALRKQARLQPAYLLASRPGLDAAPAERKRGASRRAFALALLLALAAASVLLLFDPATGTAAAGAFFGAGAAVLAAGLFLAHAVLVRPSAGASALASLGRLGRSNATRRASRSLATIALIAIGAFLVLSVSANEKGPPRDSSLRGSGTGGFALYGATGLPVSANLNEPRGRESFGLSEEALEGVSFVPLRVRAGDEASCLNLARPAAPRLLGVTPEALDARGAFPFASTWNEAGSAENPWLALNATLADGAVPAIGDETSLRWQLKLAVGDTLDYVDERGRAFRVRIVGALHDTVLQGDLLIANERFEALYPSEGGFRRFLIDAPPERVKAVSDTLSRALEDVGLGLERTGERLAGFHAVQNTYLAIFQLLGALGLLLGCAGLGMVVLRNTLERRGELALAAALGFTRGRIRWLFLSEYGYLLVFGLATGLAAALVAVIPAVLADGGQAALTNVLLLVLLLAANGVFWILLAIRTVCVKTPQSVLRED